MTSILELKDLKTYFTTNRGTVKAVDGVNLKLEEGDSLGLAGESGCGKTTTALSVMRLLPNNGRIVNGEILFKGKNLLEVDDEAYRKDYRWKELSIIFQGAMNSLNPVFRVGEQITQAIHTHEEIPKEKAWDRVEKLFTMVGINPARAKDYPHEFSGGMKQRAMIALALACNPSFVVADEPVTALDVIVQAQILELLRNLRKELGLSMIMITHDLSVISDTCNKAAIMYAGHLVETANLEQLFLNPSHPYSQGLLANYPSLRGEKKGFTPIKGRPPNLLDPPLGCRFNPRCPFVNEGCKSETPKLVEIEKGHYVACHRMKR